MNKRQKLLLKWTLWALLFSLLALLIILLRPQPVDPSALQQGQKVKGLTNKLGRQLAEQAISLEFLDRTQQAGINFKHFNDKRSSLLPEDMGSGLAWADYNNDGYIDLYIVNFAHSVEKKLTANNGKNSAKLFKNLGDGTFQDVTQEAGLLQARFGNGVSWGDYNNDGWLDLYLTHFGENQLFENNHEGGFINVTAKAGVGDARFSASSSWGDFDGDGWIDLYVTNYVDFKMDPELETKSSKQNGVEVSFTMNPSAYESSKNSLYRNNKNGTFTDVAESAGVENEAGRSMGSIWMDFDNDGKQDLYVANDVSANGVYLNLGNGKFKDIGASSLAADYRGAMGLATGDIDADGDLEIFVTHWLAQENAFFVNMTNDGFEDENGDWRLFFMDDADGLGLGQISLNTVGWATGMVDLNNDGTLDLWVVNGGTLEEKIGKIKKLKPQPFHLFQNQKSKGFFEVGPQALKNNIPMLVGRGGAHADYDNDGKVDIALLGHGAEIRLLKNNSRTDHNWIGLQLRQTNLNRFALGARVEITIDKQKQYFQVGAENTYMSQHDMTVHVGLNSASIAEELTIYWPDGKQSTHRNLLANQIHLIYHQDSYQ